MIRLLLPIAIVCASCGCGEDGAARPEPAGSSGDWFVEVAAGVGIDFVHTPGATGEYYFPEIMGPGCALLDVDGDGDLDVYLIQGGSLGPGGRDAGRPARNALFRNELIAGGSGSGTLRFVDVTESSGAGATGYGMGAATADYDNDGDVDIYVTNFGPDVLLRNDGDGTFTDVTAGSGLGDPRWNSSATFLDFDADGWLDLYVAAYNDFTLATHKECFLEGGARDYCNPKAYLPVPGVLYRNLGGSRFEDVTGTSGVDSAYGHGLGVAAADFDGNGWIDLYVANDGDANQLWMNQDGSFTNRALISGSAFNEHGMAEAGMGIGAEDFDHDGDQDLFLTHLKGESNRLLENMGGGFFEDATTRSGLGLPSIPFTGFGVGWLDADRDADLDLFIANGDVSKIEELAGDPYPYHQTNQLMINRGAGKFEDGSAEAGSVLARSEVGRGAALGDLDNDGDVDILVANNNGPARLLRNDTRKPGNWIILRVMDGNLGRDAFGAIVRLTLADGRVLTRRVHTDGSYLSASDPRVHLTWPASIGMRSLEIVAPSGTVTPVTGLSPGTIATIAIDTGAPEDGR